MHIYTEAGMYTHKHCPAKRWQERKIKVLNEFCVI